MKMAQAPVNRFFVAPQYQPLLRQLGLDGPAFFTDKRIIPWRMLPDRENCTLDAELPSGVRVRWHVKRYPPRRGGDDAIAQEVSGHRAIEAAGIATAPMVGYGSTQDGRSVIIFDDLTGYRPADKLVKKDTPFQLLLEPTADLAARLHNAGLHHRDLYLCHFMARTIGDKPDVRLIDTARVKPLPGALTRNRWIVKDLAQFWFSTLSLSISDRQRNDWLERYALGRRITRAGGLRRRIERKVRSIARHDQRLHRNRPERDVSIPETS